MVKNIISNLLKVFTYLFVLNIEAAAPLDDTSFQLKSLYAIQKKLSSYTNINVQDENGDTPLIIAAKNQNFLLAVKLIEIGADLTLRNNENKIFLDFLPEQMQKDCISAYCSKHNKLLKENIYTENDQILVDLKNKYLDLFNKLMDRNNNLETKEIDLRRFINLLDGPIYVICNDIYINYISLRLYNAVLENDTNMFFILLNNNKEYINYIYQPHNITLLILACINYRPEIVQILLNLNADLTIKDINNQTALEIAKQNKFYDIVEMLEEKGTKILGKRKIEDSNEESGLESWEAVTERQKQISQEETKESIEKSASNIEQSSKPERKKTKCKCGLVVPDISRHKTYHKKINTPYICYDCKIPSYFITKRGLDSHRSKAHDIKKLCECGLEPSDMMKHKKMHIKIKTEFICFGEGKCKIPSYFKNFIGLRRHVTHWHKSREDQLENEGGKELENKFEEPKLKTEKEVSLSETQETIAPQKSDIPQIMEVPQEVPQLKEVPQPTDIPQETDISYNLEQENLYINQFFDQEQLELNSPEFPSLSDVGYQYLDSIDFQNQPFTEDTPFESGLFDDFKIPENDFIGVS